MKLRFCTVILMLCIAACAPKQPASSSDDPPPTGTWTGDYGPSPERRESISVDLLWKNAELHGTVYSGARSMMLTRAVFQKDTGNITMEFDAQANGGQIVHYVIDGKVDGNTMSGTWKRDNQHGDFKVTKQVKPR